MDHAAYDLRDAQQRCFGFVGFAFLFSWAVWAGLWAPGVHRLPIVPTVIMVVGLWGPALATKLTHVLFRPRRADEKLEPEQEPAPPRAYWLAILLVVACCTAALGLSHAMGGCRIAWSWHPTGEPLIFVGGTDYLPIEFYDVLNYIGLAAQTIVAELFFAFLAMVMIAAAEIGFRGLLLPTVVRLGFRPWLAAVIVGAILGVWLFPLAWRGDLTGFYPGEPLRGMVVVLAAATAWGVLLGWVYLRYSRLGPTIAAATCVAWWTWSLPNVCTAYDPLRYADPRSLSCAAIVAALAALLWYIAPPSAVGPAAD